MDGRTRRILVIDDDLLITSTLLATLTHHGYRCEWAANIEASLDCLADRPFDAILLDLDLGNDHGTMLATAAADAGITLPPIVVTSDASDVELRASAKILIALSILAKPFTTEELIGALRQAAPARKRTGHRLL